jgi:predicted permease
MSKRMIGLVLNLIVSIGIGVLAAQRFFVLFDKTVPAGSMTDLVRTGTHAAYITSGVFFGVVIFGWAAGASWLARFFQPSSRSGATATRQSAK